MLGERPVGAGLIGEGEIGYRHAVESNVSHSRPDEGRDVELIRDVFLTSCAAGREVLAAPQVARAWDRPSALDQMTVGALAGHLMRAVTSVDAYLDRPAPAGAELLDAAGYFVSIEGIVGDDLDRALHASIRRRAEEESLPGHAGVVERWDTTLERLRGRLGDLAPDHIVAALGGRGLLVDEYLVTRLVELLVHTDDLAVSVGHDRPSFPFAAESTVIECLVEVARRRHGAAAVITALTRTERDVVHALRVL